MSEIIREASAPSVPDWQRTAHRRRVVHVDTWGHVRELIGWKRERILAVAEAAGTYYEPFDIRSIGTEKWRHIDNPQHGELRALQASLQRRLLRHVPMPKYIVGGVRGRSIRDNALLHAGNPVAVTIDLRNCFPNITHRDVFRAFSEGLGYRNDIAEALTKVTTFCGRVPQGAPTSTMIANLALKPMHDALAELAEDFGLVYSAWVDDLTFSGRDPVKVLQPAIEIIKEFGYAVSWNKIKVMRGWREPITVVGLVVNTGVSVGRERLGDIEAEILDLACDPVATAARLRSVQGRIAWVRSIRPSQGDRLERLADRVLSPIGLDGTAPKRTEIRACRRARRHVVRRVATN